jgi:5-methylcytosine-specific restriction endonuclease McrA
MRKVIPRRKRCSQCGELKRLSEFYYDHRASDRRQSECKVCHRASVNVTNDSYRAQAFEHYGTSCVCCGSTMSLQLDHVHGNGDEHRQKIGSTNSPTGGVTFYAYLISRGFPADCEPGGEYELQVLCGSCNNSKGDGDHCQAHCTEHNHRRRIRTLADVAAEKAVRDSRIFKLRAQGLTQAQIAAEVGCTQPTVGRVLRAA